jgi:Leucine-rich repeat (LRR) protein
MKELNLSKLNLIESHLEPLGSMRDHTFPSLLKLNLSHNRLSLIPAFVFRLKTLHSLNMSNNSLVRVSDHLTELVNLEVLDLWRNNLNVVPFIVYKLKRIRKVDLSNNKIVSVQPWMLDGPIKIDLFGNPLVLTEVMNEKTKKKPEFLNGFIKKLNRSMI